MSNTVTINNPELVIGLVGPIGVDLDAIVSFLESGLKDVAYQSQVIHITKVMRDLLPQMRVEEDSYSARYRSLISNADTVRRTIDNQAALACLAISEIRRLRQELQPKMDPKIAREAPLLGTAFIVRQFKREEEIALLRQVYGRKFIQISVFSDKEERRSQLVKKIKEYGTGTIEEDDAEKQAIDLISIDNNEISDEYGQRVSDVFHRGDVFVRGEVNQGSKSTVERFIRAFFGHNSYSPTKTEYGMYAAAGAALRSLDLSRQVGAAVFSPNGEVIALGCNEVPKPFGGTYWCDDAGDKHRDFEEGADGNHSRKIRVIDDLVERMGKLGFLSEKLLSSGSTHKQVRRLMSEKSISDSKVMDLIEFGRIIHAEMSAITDAARLGKALAGSILFCTTFPCHMCAKHIVSSGVRRVVFLEPYPKSHAKDLHADSITFSPAEREKKVLFEPFIGISPRRYRDIFEKKKRKDQSGKASSWYEGRPVPRIEDKSSAYIENEEPAISLVTRKILEMAGA
ncbi:Cytidine/deoxycytidylate deaminase,zinc-binding region [Mesorhizobium metallidurans STM 2683]|uniref:Cytidine/deoxycytidylate deaminase,zinc-binding region n=1 Tax=Mesorhizobium metallidurans STM 2683 TaxID=1297569 RepID=M5EQY1_9HYPH|nr:anti-phage dCTP deaminase [Mesorhizobium metallidurans]CCV06510.1 Cytidine/deoxycytidylate deaminase,zinc-binding region [Mesorhizobium metallidurans STM 2683]